MASRHGLRRAMVVAIVSMLVALTTLELTLRVFGAYLPGTYRIGSLIEPDDVLGWRHVRSDAYASRSPEWNVRFALNGQGRRGPLVGEKVPGVRRVAIFGDSFVEAAQVADAQTMGSRLRDALGAARAEVIDEGVSGYGVDQDVLEFERDAHALDLDAAVLVLALTNDVWNDYEPFESTRPTTVKPYFDLRPDGGLAVRPAPPMSLWDRLRLAYARSAALSMLKSAFAPDRPAIDLRRQQLAVLEPAAGGWEEAWRISEAVLTRFVSSARQAGVAPLLVIAPDGCQVHEDLCEEARELASSHLAQDRLASHAARIGLPVVDLLPAFRAEAARGTRLYFRRDLHWTAEGHALAASTIAETVRAALERPR